MSCENSPPENAGARPRFPERALCVALLLLTGWLYFWCALQPDGGCFSRDPDGYYGLQAAGFRKGQLNMALEPHPALLAMADPYDPVANAPYRVHDMTFYRGKYYMYFGSAPTVLFFWPIAAATGYYPTEPLAVAFFCFAGFAAGLGLLQAFRARYAPGVSNFWFGAVGLAWALGSYVSGLLHRPGFYQVPIACAFMLLMLGLAAAYRAMHAAQAKSAGRNLALAGALVGLCLGCRPNYLLAPLLLLVPAAWLARRWGDQAGTKFRHALRFGLLAFGPVALAGLAVLAHNHARFGNPFEFGMRLQLAGERMEYIVLLSPRHLPHNLQGYLFGHGWWWPYFPFLTHGSEPLGGLRYFPLGFLGLLALWPGRAAGAWPARAAFVATVAAAGVANVIMLSCFYWVTDRYAVDYLPSLILAGGCGALLAREWLQRPTGAARAGRIGLGAVLMATAASGIAVILANSPARTRQWAPLEYSLNRPSLAWMESSGRLPGLLRCTVVFPRGMPGEMDPLVESGLFEGQRDALMVEHCEGGRVRFRFFHAGSGGPVSEPVEIEPGRPYRLEMLYGALLPPARHPYFAGWTESEIATARNKLLVRLDGRPVMEGSLGTYDSRPWDVHLGWSAYASGNLAARFRGRLQLDAVERIQRTDFPVPLVPSNEAVRLRLVFPVDRPAGWREPLLTTGAPGNGSLLYVQYAGPGRAKFGIDHYGAGGPLSSEVRYDPAQPQELLVWMGSWAARPDRTRQRLPDESPAGQRLLVVLNGEVVFDCAQPFRETTVPDTTVGRNPHGSTMADAVFSGRLLHVAGMPYETLPARPPDAQPGAVVMSVLFPTARAGTSDPLVTTGRTGAGDFLYVRYIDEGHVSFGFDHWGIGGLVSDPVPIEVGRTYRLELTMGSLHDAGVRRAELRELVQVKLDDRVVLEGRSPCHPTSLAEIRIAANEIGGSNAGRKFLGTILALSRPPEPAPRSAANPGP